MNETRPRNWYYIFSYLTISIVTLGILYILAEWFFPKTSAELIPRNDALSARFLSGPRLDNNLEDTRNKATSDIRQEKITLALNQEKEFTKSKIIYRGLDEKSRLIIDVVILDLDPETYYPYRIHTYEARRGFRLAGQNFKLISARKSALKLRRIKR